MSTNQGFTRERKLEIVQRILVGGERVCSVARSLDIDEKIVSRWRREYLRNPEKAFSQPSRFRYEAIG